MLIFHGKLQETPRAPVSVQDAVELWARRSGRHARVEWVPFMACWCVVITRKPGDPALRATHEGLIDADTPREFRDYLVLSMENEVVALQEPGNGDGYVPIPLEHLGADGLVQFLERRDTWSGRGEHDSLDAALRATRQRNEDNAERMQRAIVQAARDRAGEDRRQALGIPLVRGADLT